jgi:hypothetical protein
MNNFNAVQEAAQVRGGMTMSSETLARQIVAAAQGDARLAYDFLDTLNKTCDARCCRRRSDDQSHRRNPRDRPDRLPTRTENEIRCADRGSRRGKSIGGHFA